MHGQLAMLLQRHRREGRAPGSERQVVMAADQAPLLEFVHPFDLLRPAALGAPYRFSRKRVGGGKKVSIKLEREQIFDELGGCKISTVSGKWGEISTESGRKTSTESGRKTSTEREMLC